MAIKFELVIPAYNEAKNLRTLIERVFSSAEVSGLGLDQFRLLLVNNGSRDSSSIELNKLRNEHPEWANCLKIVEVPMNQGYGHGIWSGLLASEAEYVGWTHADLQCDPLNAFKGLQLLWGSIGSSDLQGEVEKSRILVKGVRHGRSTKEVIVSRVFEFCARLILGLRLHEINAQPKVFKRDLLNFIKDPPKTFAFDLYVLYCALKNNYRIKIIDVEFPPRIHGVSNWAATFLGRYKTIWGMITYMWQLRCKERRTLERAQ